MAMAFTAPRALLAINILLAGLCGLQCRNRQTKLPLFSADSIELKNKNGTWYVVSTAFTGILFALNTSGDSVFSKCYVNGLEEGVHTTWYSNGQVMEKRQYQNGKKNGRGIAFWPDGTKRYEYYFTSDLYEGVQYEWYAGGAPYLKKKYVAGYENGLQQSWNTDGSVRYNYEAKNGRNYGNIGKKNCYSVWKDSAFVGFH